VYFLSRVVDWLKECLYLLQNTNDSPWQYCSNFLENYQFILWGTWRVFAVPFDKEISEILTHDFDDLCVIKDSLLPNRRFPLQSPFSRSLWRDGDGALSFGISAGESPRARWSQLVTCCRVTTLLLNDTRRVVTFEVHLYYLSPGFPAQEGSGKHREGCVWRVFTYVLSNVNEWLRDSRMIRLPTRGHSE